MLNSLTSFRFIAAFMVFIFHMEIFNQFQLGSAGVQFFFVLSGFILAYNYQSKLTKLNKNDLFKFYRARFAKVYPVHFLTFLIAVPLVLLYFNPNGHYFLKLAFMSVINLSLIQSYIPNQGTYFNFNGVSWTLSVEALFYLMFPFLLWIFIKLKVSKNIIVSISILAIVWTLLFFLNANLDENNEFHKWLLHIFPVTRLFEFSTGMILGILFTRKPSRESVNKTLFTSLELLSIGLFVLLLWLSVGLDVGIVRGVYFVPVWCMLIYIFAHQGGLFSKILSHKTLVYLGEISFSFYMIHQLVIRYFDFLQLDKTIDFFICLGISLLLSVAMYHYYEEPMRKRLRYGVKKKELAQLKTSSVTS